MSKESDFLEKLRDTFKGESEEHRSMLLTGLLELEKGNCGKERTTALIDILFRNAHSLKGAARAVNIREIEQLCQYLEDIFSAMKKGLKTASTKMFDAMYRALDLITSLTKDSAAVSTAELESTIVLLRAETKEAQSGKATEDPVKKTETAAAALFQRPQAINMSETVRISNTLLGSIFLGAEEMLSVKQALLKHTEDLSELLHLQEQWNTCRDKLTPTIVKLRKQAVDDRKLQTLLEFIDVCNEHSKTITEKLAGLYQAGTMDSLHGSERIDYLQSEIKTALMLPFSSLMESFSMMVRDLARAEEKEVSWNVHGDDTLIDRRVLERIKDPLIHIVRNSVSHGIESAEKRVSCGKARAGQITVTIARVENDTVEITVSDDGAGIDLTAVKKAAVEKGLISEINAHLLDDASALELIFLSELSTSPIISAISGRGLGLAIAREKIATAGGQLSVEMKESLGTTFRMRIPVSLATFRGVIVKDTGQSFIIPTRHIDQVIRVNRSKISLVDNRETIVIDKQIVALVNLSETLGRLRGGNGSESDENSFVVVLLVNGTRIALRVDEVIGEQEVLARTLGKNLIRVRNVSGTTVLATGEVIPILNPFDLLRSVILSNSRPAGETESKPEAKSAVRVLIVDDSVTSRTMLKGLMESAGYAVTTAIDGVEAFTLLRSEKFDLLVSDIEMPRMNGFELCKKTRAFSRTADMPIVLITSLNSNEDKERGIDAGANAYIAKSGFDQKNLLDIVKRLV